MSLKRIEEKLEQKTGLSVETIGTELVNKVVLNRMEICQLSRIDDYSAYLETSGDEWEELIEAVVIPETWFFRNQQSFLFLSRYIHTEWLPKNPTRLLRMLSFPCSTGEEPYSMVMALLDAGFPAHQMRVDALDVSKRVLKKAISGVYGRESFRGADVFPWRERYFHQIDGEYHLQDSIKESVHFTRGNLLDKHVLHHEDAYDVVFCRNVLIYLGEEAKKYAVTTLDRLLDTKGILFVGHAERSVFQDAGYEWIQQPGVFACRKTGEPLSKPSEKKVLLPVLPPGLHKKAHKKVLKPKKLSFRPVFERRQTERFTLPQQKHAGRDHKNRSHETGDTGIERRHSHDQRDELLDTARLLADQGQLTQALTLCDKVLNQMPTHVEANFLKGLIYQALRDEEQAEALFSRTIYLDPNHYEALNYLAFLAEHQGDHEKASLLRQRMARIQNKGD